MTPGAIRQRLDRLRAGGDAGVSLIEVVVSMAIMSILMAMFTTGILQLYRSTNRTEAMSTAQSQVNLAFLRLDKQIRYASAISTPGGVGTDTYVEYLVTVTGTPVCTELRLRTAARQLQRRTWTQGTSPVTPSAWLPLASNVGATQPFRLLAPDSTFTFQRLEINLVAGSAAASSAASRQTDVTFTALNTSLTTTSTGVCIEGRSIP